MRQRSEAYLQVKERLTHDELIKYLIVYQMSLTLLGKRFNVSSTFIKKHMDDTGFDLEKQKAKYYHEHYLKIQVTGTGIKVKRRTPRKPFAVIR